MTMNRRSERTLAVRSTTWITATALGVVLTGCGGSEAPLPPAPVAASTVEAPPVKGRGKLRPTIDVSSRHERNKKRAAEARPGS